MAGTDKMYLTYDEYLVLKEWCSTTTLTYHNGKKGSPGDFLFSFIEEPWEGDKPVWSTLEAFDKWLYHNCPLSFIQRKLREQYLDPDEYFNEKKPLFTPGYHYKVLSKPEVKYQNRYWYLSFDPKYYYGFTSKIVYTNQDIMPPECIGIGHMPIENLTKRKLNRLIKKGWFEVGTIITIYNKYIGSEYKIRITK